MFTGRRLSTAKTLILCNIYTTYLCNLIHVVTAILSMRAILLNFLQDFCKIVSAKNFLIFPADIHGYV